MIFAIGEKDVEFRHLFRYGILKGGEEMKKTIAVVMIIVLMLTTFVYAETESVNNTLRLNFDGASASCYIKLYYPGKSIDATLKLYKGNTLKASWHKTGTTTITISGTHGVVSGSTYTLKVTGTAGGSALSVTPVTKTCP